MSWLIYNDKALVIDSTSKIVVGRGAGCEIVVLDCLASRRHATIVYRQGHVSIIDNGSRNGTMVNGLRISGSHELRDRDRIVVGSSEILFSMQPPVNVKEAGRISFTPAAGEDTLSTVTGTGTGMMLLSSLFTKAIEGNHLEQAQKIVMGLSERVAKGASSGTLSRAELVPVTDMVLKFAKVTADLRWLDWLIRVHERLRLFPAPHAAKRMHDIGVELGMSDGGTVSGWLAAVHGREKSEADTIARQHLQKLAQFADSTLG